MERQLFLRTCGLSLSLIALAFAGRQLVVSALASDAPTRLSGPVLSAPCRAVSTTVLSCRLAGKGFVPFESISIRYTLEIPVRPELAPIRPTPKLWGLEPPRVQCLTNRRDACVRYRTSDHGLFGPLLVHLTYLKMPQSGGATTQFFRVTVVGAQGDQATVVLPGPIRVVP